MFCRKFFHPNHSSKYEEAEYNGILFWLKPRSTSSSLDYAFPCLYIQHEKPKGVVIYAHGFNTDMGTDYFRFVRLSDACSVNVLLLEYPGYGISPGKPSYAKIDAHMDRALEFLMEEAKWNLSDIVMFGNSIGTGPICRSARKYSKLLKQEPAGFILQSTFASTEMTSKEHGEDENDMANNDGWDNCAELKQTTTPVHIVHGAKDEMVPLSHVNYLRQQLFSALPKRNIVHTYCMNADHTQFDVERLDPELYRFINQDILRNHRSRPRLLLNSALFQNNISNSAFSATNSSSSSSSASSHNYRSSNSQTSACKNTQSTSLQDSMKEMTLLYIPAILVGAGILLVNYAFQKPEEEPMRNVKRSRRRFD